MQVLSINELYNIEGNNNKILFVKNGKEICVEEKIQGLDVRIKGNNNTIKLEQPFIPTNSVIIIENDNVNINIGSTNYFRNVIISCFLGDKQKLTIGKNTKIVECHFILEEEGEIYVGENCLFSSKILFRTSDGHSIISQKDKKVLTKKAKKVQIGNHVWIGIETMVLKNSRVGNDCIIGARSIVNKVFDKDNALLAGIPAKIIKTGVNWRQENPWMLENGIIWEK